VSLVGRADVVTRPVPYPPAYLGAIALQRASTVSPAVPGTGRGDSGGQIIKTR